MSGQLLQHTYSRCAKHWRRLFTFLRRLRLLGLDMVLIACAVGAAYLIRFDARVPVQDWAQIPRVLVWWVIVREMWLLFYRFYDQTWEYASVRELLVTVSALTSGTISLYLLNLLLPFDGFHNRVPRSIFIIEWFLALAFLGGVRLLIRIRHETRQRDTRGPSSSDTKRLLIVGAGDAGTITLRELRQSKEWQVVGFVDDDPRKRKHLVAGVPVLGNRLDIPKIVEMAEVDEILVAMPSASRETMREIIAISRGTGCPVRTLPALYELIDGRVTVNQIREVRIEDLLGREPVRTDIGSISAYLHNETVLVTGAGGSIGGELSRQIARFGPKRLVLLGHGENSIFSIEREIRGTYPLLELEAVIADIRDRVKVDHLFDTYRPAVVFHAAAHKHVPLMEANPDEAVTNNVLGTRNLVESSKRSGTKRFVMISTDKAVRPVSVMGCSKRVAEMIVQAANDADGTRFVAVRFGNVLGSRGSVVPIFKKQIEAGGPVTVTHPEMRRYFMTITEAVQLVIQAGALGKGGEIFLLAMGEPVRILDLAQDMIRLSGFEPGVDIPIVFTGPRPGEKLFEELNSEGEDVLPTEHPKIVKLRSTAVREGYLRQMVEALEQAAVAGDPEQVRLLLHEFAGESLAWAEAAASK